MRPRKLLFFFRPEGAIRSSSQHTLQAKGSRFPPCRSQASLSWGPGSCVTTSLLGSPDARAIQGIGFSTRFLALLFSSDSFSKLVVVVFPRLASVKRESFLLYLDRHPDVPPSCVRDGSNIVEEGLPRSCGRYPASLLVTILPISGSLSSAGTSQKVLPSHPSFHETTGMKTSAPVLVRPTTSRLGIFPPCLE